MTSNPPTFEEPTPQDLLIIVPSGLEYGECHPLALFWLLASCYNSPLPMQAHPGHTTLQAGGEEDFEKLKTHWLQKATGPGNKRYGEEGWAWGLSPQTSSWAMRVFSSMGPTRVTNVTHNCPRCLFPPAPPCLHPSSLRPCLHGPAM